MSPDASVGSSMSQYFTGLLKVHRAPLQEEEEEEQLPEPPTRLEAEEAGFG